MSHALKQRVTTGLILLTATLVLLFYLPPPAFQLVSGVFFLMGAWEWTTLASLKSLQAKIAYLVTMTVIMTMTFFLPILPVLVIAFFWWCLALVWVGSFPHLRQLWHSKLMRLIIGVLVIVPCWLSINVLKSSANGAWLLLFLLCLVWAADIGAYFSGKWWGTTKLLPQVSPGKTWQGCAGGLLFSLIVALIGASFLAIDFSTWLFIIGFAIVINVFSVVGDLLESMLKRHNRLKDSGSLLPGHGGILDRVDSLTAAAPIFLLGFLLHLYFAQL